jgi:hypothetical protein
MTLYPIELIREVLGSVQTKLPCQASIPRMFGSSARERPGARRLDGRPLAEPAKKGPNPSS